jgi:hypothetical protein
MKYIKIFVSVIVGVILLIGIAKVTTIIQLRREDTENVDLHLPPGRTDIKIIQSFTKLCRPTELSQDRFPTKFVGLSTNIPSMIDEKYFSLTKELGINWMRVFISWRDIERPDGTYDWTATDKTVADIKKHDIHLLATLYLIPTNLHTWDDIDEHYRKFIKAFAERYTKDGVTYFEVFNEPNLPGYGWLDRVTKPEGYIGEYAIMLAIANEEIRKVNGDAVILNGGISSDDVHGMPYGQFLTQMLSYGTTPCFDVLAFHPYGLEGRFATTRDELQGILAQTGVRERPIWFDEYGTPEDTRLPYTIESMYKEKDVADAWFWYTLRDLRPDHRWGYGLTDYNYVKKDAFGIFKKYFTNKE